MLKLFTILTLQYIRFIKRNISLVFYLSFSQIIVSQNGVSYFQQITIDNGLSNNSINQIYQDKEGLIWIATQDGLNKYDGYHFQIYRQDRSDTNSLSSSWINCICEDSKGRLWIGTQYGGLNLYDKERDVFIRCTDNYEKKRLKKSPDIETIIEGPDGNIWLGTFYSGLIKYNPGKKTFEHFYTTQLGVTNPTYPEIFKLEVFDKDNLLVPIYRKGLFVFNVKTNKFMQLAEHKLLNEIKNIYKENDKTYYFCSANDGIISFEIDGNSFKTQKDQFFNIDYPYIKQISKDSHQNYWIASIDGLYRKTNEGTSLFKSDRSNSYSLISDNVSCVFSDNNNGVWIGTQDRGIDYYTYTSGKFNANQLNNLKLNEISDAQISDIEVDDEGNYWFAAEGKGICCLNSRANKMINYSFKDIGIKVNGVFCIHIDSKTKGIWIGSNGGLSYWDRKSRFAHNFPADGNPKGTNWTYIQTIYEDKQRQVWIGLNGGGLNKYNRKDGNFSYFNFDFNNDKSISSSYVTAIFEDKKGQLWVGTGGAGLNKLNVEDNSFERICLFSPKNNIFEDAVIHCINEPAFPGIWIGTTSGLVYYNDETGVIKHFNTKDGLPDNTINSIEIDNEGNLWLGTNNGFSKAVVPKFDKKINDFESDIKFINYNKKDGLINLIFPANSSCTTKEGFMLFGTLNGMISFVPENIRTSVFQPTIIITQLSIGDKVMKINDTINQQVPLKKNIGTLDHLILNYKNRNFSIDFAALDFSSPNKNEYLYMLEGYDKEWKKTDGTRRNATYTNLDPGAYKLLIKASNCDGLWSTKIKTLKITIIPPWWQTWWAYLTYYIVLISLFVLYFIIMSSKVNLKKTLEFEKKSREKEEELSQMKSRFFTNITHEFKTPITLILGPAEQLLERANEDSYVINKVRSIYSNALRMLNLINELLSIRKIETGKEKLSIKEINIVQFAQNISTAFNESASIRNMIYETDFPESQLNIFIDPVKIEKVIYNILSNAFKFSPDESMINFSIEIETPESGNNGFVALEVKDNGIGISADELEKIFDRFYVHNDRNTMSMGIGLSLAKDYVEMHKGKIIVESIEKKGTTIKVLLPMGKEHFQPEELSHDDDYHVNTEFIRDNVLLAETEKLVPTSKNNMPTLLIVEDNVELQQFICNSLQNSYNILYAGNGEEGEKIAKDQIPDLIISDIMMPIKDGIEMCRALKGDILTNHIPIILLTARSQENDKIEAYKLGADAHIPKPFHLKHLKVRIKNLIDQRNLLKDKYWPFFEKVSETKDNIVRLEIKNHVNEISDHGLNNKFLNTLYETIVDNISDPELNIEKICKILNMSYVQFYRKVKALTDLSVKDIIINTRLKSAAKMIIERKVNVSEAGYLTGFNSPAYFTKCFKDHYGVTPTEYIEKNK